MATQVADVKLGDAMSWLLSCVQVCAGRAGREWEPPLLAAVFGHAFESSYALGGGELWSGCACEWTWFGSAVARLGLRPQAVDYAGKNPSMHPSPSPEKRKEALDRAWDLVRSSAERGVPAVVWSPMSREQRDSGMQAYCWGLVEGVDASTREYLVYHSTAGRFRTPSDGLGQVDNVEWVHAFTFDGADPAYSDAKTVAATVSDALLYLRGERPGADMPAPPETIRHGPGAFYEWAGEVERGKRNVGHPGWWARGRDSAARFCAWARAAVPAFDPPLAEAESAFRAQADTLRSLADGGLSADGIRRVATLQGEAISALSRVPLG